MKNIYNFIIKKNKGSTDKLLSDLLDKINSFYKSLNINLKFISFPGYLSVTKNTCDLFYNNFPLKKGYFLKPLNLRDVTSNYTNQSYLNFKFGNYNCSLRQTDDHSKILALIENYDSSYNQGNNKNIESNYKIHGLLIGSSNQSYNTYYKIPSSKGECDILLLDLDMINNNKHTPINNDEIIYDIYNSVIEKNIENDAYFSVNKQIASNTSEFEDFFRSMITKE